MIQWRARLIAWGAALALAGGLGAYVLSAPSPEVGAIGPDDSLTTHGVGPRTPASPFPSPAPALDAHDAVVLLSTPVQGDTTDVLFVKAASTGAVPHVHATIQHLAGATARGCTTPQGETFVIADHHPTRDTSFRSALYRIEIDGTSSIVDHGAPGASRPLCTAEGVFYATGSAGPAEADALRTDAFELKRYEPVSQTLSTLASTRGQLMFVVGLRDREIITYEVMPSEARLVAVDLDSGARQDLVSLAPFARDFSIDAATGDIVFQQKLPADRNPTPGNAFGVARWQRESGDVAWVAERLGASTLPHALSDGRVAFYDDAPGWRFQNDRAVRIADDTEAKIWVRAPQSIPARRSDGILAALLTRPSALPQPVLIDVAGDAVLPLAAPDATRIEIAGFIASAAAEVGP